MTTDDRAALTSQLWGANSHVHKVRALEGLDVRLAGRRVGAEARSVHEILLHMIYWHDISLRRLAGQSPPRPASAALGWAAALAPASAAEWLGAVARFADGLRQLEAIALDTGFDLGVEVPPGRGVSALGELLMIAGHDSYHLGQIVLLRRQLGSWPPPGGGDTW